MVRTCCVPSCRSNYSFTKDRKYVSCFKFPKDEKLKLLWIKAIPRQNFTPSSYSAVCEKHFEESDVIKEEKYLLPDGTVQMLLLRLPKLKQNAIPKFYLDSPKSPPNRKSTQKKARTDTQLKNEILIQQDNDSSSDKIEDFEDLINNYSNKIDVSGWEIKKVDNTIYFYILNYEKSLSVDVSVQIDRNLQLSLFIKGVEISPKDLKWLLPADLIFSRWSQLTNLLSHYKNVSYIEDSAFMESKEFVKLSLSPPQTAAD